MKLLDLINKWFPKESKYQNLGAKEDNRSDGEKENDIHHSDIVASPAPVVWNELDLTKLPNWPVLSQYTTSACVAFTKAIMATMLYYARTGVMLVFSPKWIYNWRINKNIGSGEGMIGTDAFDIEASQGLIPEAMLPSQDLNETQINNFTAEPWLKEVGKALRMSDQRIILPIKDIEIIASTSQTTNKPMMVWFRFGSGEWTSIPTIMSISFPYHHSVTVPSKKEKTDMVFGLYNGKKAIVIQDSYSLNSTEFSGKRIITEDFFKSRNSFAAYSMRFRFEAGGEKPKYEGTVISLQKCLRYEGLFPLGIDYIESYGPVTKKSVAQFQLNHNLLVTSLLDMSTKNLLGNLYP